MVLSWLDQDAIAEKLHPNYKTELSAGPEADLRKEIVDTNLLQEAGRIPQELWNPREKQVAAAINAYVESLNVAPAITALEPNTAPLGSPDLVMVVAGTGFVNGHSTIFFNGYPEPTTFIDDTHISTGIKPSIFTVAEALPVLVRNESAESNSLDWTFTAAEGGVMSRGKGKTFTGTIAAGSLTTLTLTAPSDFVPGQGIAIAGAGPSGGPLLTTVATIDATKKIITLSTPATAAVTSVSVQPEPEHHKVKAEEPEPVHKRQR